jgi:hypothetical protein
VKRTHIILACFAFIASAWASPSPDAPGEYALLIPRSALVAEIERLEAMALLIAYGSGSESYAAGFAAGQIYRAKAQLSTLDGIVAGSIAIDK